MIKEECFVSYKDFLVDGELKSYFKSNGVLIKGEPGFYLDCFKNKNIASLFAIAKGNPTNWRLKTQSTIFELKCPNVQMKKIKLSEVKFKINKTGNVKLKNIRYEHNKKQEIEACYPYPFVNNSSLYFIVWEVYDIEMPDHSCCNEEIDVENPKKENFFYDFVKTHFTLTSMEDKKIYIDSECKPNNQGYFDIKTKIISKSIIRFRHFLKKHKK